ncbi:ANTAR domain-containing protein [Streptomyces sp. NPDC006334]|uniref:ANTAR domain-containing protein n=1 Tax=Streptomyces sp. NPDC006334 TaxID=3156754 RepID=UPI0033B5F48A
MTTSRTQRPRPEGSRDAVLSRLEHENAQLRQAVDSHATVDQAIGVLVATHRIAPATGFEVLREVSQHTNLKLRAVAETVIGWALGQQPLPEPVGQELDAAVQRRQGDVSEGPREGRSGA